MLEATLGLATIVRRTEIHSLNDGFPVIAPFSTVAAEPIPPASRAEGIPLRAAPYELSMMAAMCLSAAGQCRPSWVRESSRALREVTGTSTASAPTEIY